MQENKRTRNKSAASKKTTTAEVNSKKDNNIFHHSVTRDSDSLFSNCIADSQRPEVLVCRNKDNNSLFSSNTTTNQNTTASSIHRADGTHGRSGQLMRQEDDRSNNFRPQTNIIVHETFSRSGARGNAAALGRPATSDKEIFDTVSNNLSCFQAPQVQEAIQAAAGGPVVLTQQQLADMLVEQQ